MTLGPESRDPRSRIAHRARPTSTTAELLQLEEERNQREAAKRDRLRDLDQNAGR